MSDLLSASSLLLAILTTIFGIFYSSINEILEIKPKTHPVDDEPNYKKALGVRKSKVYPLLFASVCLTLVFIPESLKIIIDSIKLLSNFGFKGVDYDTIKTTFLAVTIFMSIFSINIISMTIQFKRHLKKLNPKR